MTNPNENMKAYELNDNELGNVNGGFIGLMVGSFLISCAVGLGLGVLADRYSDPYGEE